MRHSHPSLVGALAGLFLGAPGAAEVATAIVAQIDDGAPFYGMPIPDPSTVALADPIGNNHFLDANSFFLRWRFNVQPDHGDRIFGFAFINPRPPVQPPGEPPIPSPLVIPGIDVPVISTGRNVGGTWYADSRFDTLAVISQLKIRALGRPVLG